LKGDSDFCILSNSKIRISRTRKTKTVRKKYIKIEMPTLLSMPDPSASKMATDAKAYVGSVIGIHFTPCIGSVIWWGI